MNTTVAGVPRGALCYDRELPTNGATGFSVLGGSFDFTQAGE